MGAITHIVMFEVSKYFDFSSIRSRMWGKSYIGLFVEYEFTSSLLFVFGVKRDGITRLQWASESDEFTSPVSIYSLSPSRPISQSLSGMEMIADATLMMVYSSSPI